jgi:VanZ family protein
MLAGTFLSNFIDLSYIAAGNILGYSILSNILMHFQFNTKRYCWLVRNIPAALILINLIDIASLFIPYTIYSSVFNVIVCSMTITLSIIFKLKKLRK